MTQEMTSFVLRFVREASEDQEARWRGLIQYVQDGSERNFATFAQAVQFMQERIVENTARVLQEGEQMTDDNPFVELAGEMTKLWGGLGPQMAEMWAQTAEQMMSQSTAFRSQVDQAVATTLKTWGLPTGMDQEAILANLARLGDQIERLTARVEGLEEKLAAQGAKPKRRRTSKRATPETTEQTG